ncbi:hypothetical protein O3P69_020260 [Scylla paramamosain]|uniref:Uncharacterized protein n=1 Tax=Scylla paramamosain TaxID=85552 RepID=A0AAW0TLD7_SCYPA
MRVHSHPDPHHTGPPPTRPCRLMSLPPRPPHPRPSRLVLASPPTLAQGGSDQALLWRRIVPESTLTLRWPERVRERGREHKPRERGRGGAVRLTTGEKAASSLQFPHTVMQVYCCGETPTPVSPDPFDSRPHRHNGKSRAPRQRYGVWTGRRWECLVSEERVRFNIDCRLCRVGVDGEVFWSPRCLQLPLLHTTFLPLPSVIMVSLSEAPSLSHGGTLLYQCHGAATFQETPSVLSP